MTTALTQVQGLLKNPDVTNRMKEIMGKRAPAFASSIISVTRNSPLLQRCDAKTIVGAAMVAAALDLPIDPNLGFAYVVPYGNAASFQMGYKGFVQLAQRSGQFKTLTDFKVPCGTLVNWDPTTETLEIDYDKEVEGPPDGYGCYFKLLNGFEKRVFWTREQVEAHGKQYSKSYGRNSSPWKQNF